MGRQPKPFKELVDELTDEEIQQLKDERMKAGATRCEVIVEGGHKYLVTQYPPVR